MAILLQHAPYLPIPFKIHTFLKYIYFAYYRTTICPHSIIFIVLYIYMFFIFLFKLCCCWEHLQNLLIGCHIPNVNVVFLNKKYVFWIPLLLVTIYFVGCIVNTIHIRTSATHQKWAISLEHIEMLD